MDIIATAKNITAVLATASTLAYISGYLALRARAYALGIDPAFKLVDEGYVFAGFRFLFITLITLLLLTPVLLFFRWVSLWTIRQVPVDLVQSIQWLLLGLVAITTIMIISKVLAVNGVLLQIKSESPLSVIQKAILGDRTDIRLLLTFSIIFLAALSALWLQARLLSRKDTFVMVLGIVLAIQLFILPICHGMLFADRKVQVLAAIPTPVRGMSTPLGVVNRASEHITLLGRDAVDGYNRLVTIKLDDLNGIPIQKIVNLNQFLENDLASNHIGNANSKRGSAMSNKLVGVENNPQDMANKDRSSKETDVKKSFLKAIIDSLNVTFEALGSLGESALDYGQLWAVDIDNSQKPLKPRRVGSVNDLSWPVAGSDGISIIALQQGKIVRVGKDGHATNILHSESQWNKLIGVNEEGTIFGFVYDDGKIKPALLLSGGRLQVMKPSSTLSGEDRKRISLLTQETRSYIGDRTLFVDRSERGGRGFDVYLKSGNEVYNLSNCGDDRCGQASFSPNFRMVLFIRQPRY